MEDLKEDLGALKLTVTELKEVNMSLRNEIESLRSEVVALSNSQSQSAQQAAQTQTQCKQSGFTETMPSKYTDTSYLTGEERREIQFEMAAYKLNCLRYQDGEPARFYDFSRKGEEDEKKPDEDNGMTDVSLGTFVTPIAGRYRFDVVARMGGSGKAEWYICCIPKAEVCDEDDNDTEYDSDASDDDVKAKEMKKEKQRVFKEKTTRHLLFTFDTDKNEYFQEGSVGMDCEKDLFFWTEVVVLEGKFVQFDCGVRFGGRLVC